MAERKATVKGTIPNEGDMRVSFVVCGNGYGHLKRTLQVAGEMLKNSSSHIQVIGATCHETRFREWMTENEMKDDNPVFVNGLTETNLRIDLPSDYSFSDYSTSLQRIQEKIEGFNPDRVVSDNLVGILQHREDALLMGSFLWGDVLNGGTAAREIADFEDGLLRKVSPEMIGVSDIVMPGVKQRTRFVGLPWFCDPPQTVENEAHSNRKRVLVTGGGTNVLGDLLGTLATELARDKRFEVLADSKLHEAAKGQLEKFSFSPGDFRKLDWIVCRPGAGILTEAVRYRIPLCTLADNNKEMIHNAACVERMGIGFSHRGIDNSREFMLSQGPGNYEAAFDKLETGGAVTAARYILNSR